MGGRGTFAAGKNVAYQYETVGSIEGVKVLKGINGKHALPEEAHSSNAYIKLNKNGDFKEMRIYDDKHFAILEIGYHPEKNLGKDRVLHYHVIDTTNGSFNHLEPKLITEELYQKYKKYFKGVKR